VTDIKKTFYILGILLFFVSSTFAQIDLKSTDNPGKLLKNAKKALEFGDIFTAIDAYQKYETINSENSKVHHDLGQLLLREKNYKEAEKYLSKAYEASPNKYILDLFDYALCQKILENYDEAIKSFNNFIKVSKGDQELKEYARIAKSHIDIIEEIPEMKNQKKNMLVILLDTAINKPHIEFSPIPYDNGNKLIWGSLQEKQINYYDVYKDKLPVRKFFMAQKVGNSWKNLGEFDTTINGHDTNTGNGVFSLDKNRFYFTRCNFDNSFGKVLCKIFVSKLENSEWQTPEELPEIINAKKATTTMPAIGISKQNTDILYFVSDREGGRGGMDLWFTFYDRKKNEWKEAKNCGKKINTIGDEITPYYNIDTKTLYFSSNGLPTIGGFDIFKSFGEAKSFEAPENLGFPINSSYDDLYFVFEDSREKGFLTSNRPGGYSLRHSTCCDDIYQFIDKDFISIVGTGRVLGIVDPAFYKSIEKDYKNQFTLDMDLSKNSDDVKILYDYPVNLYIVDNSGKEIFVKTDYTTNGNYYFNLEQGAKYVIKVVDVNKTEKKLALNTQNIFKSDTVHLDAIIVNTLPIEPIIVKNIYYEFNDYKLSEDAKKTIDSTIFRILTSYPNIIIEISSHTDSIGSEKLNDKLSQQRAQSVVDYLINKGIDKNRLVARGYGKSKPIAPNSNPDGSDNPEGRQKNRRTEFKIIGLQDNLEELLYEDD
jgi:outer membrane protein OmpA-like peptidoglycan-associated protein